MGRAQRDKTETVAASRRGHNDNANGAVATTPPPASMSAWGPPTIERRGRDLTASWVSGHAPATDYRGEGEVRTELSVYHDVARKCYRAVLSNTTHYGPHQIAIEPYAGLNVDAVHVERYSAKGLQTVFDSVLAHIEALRDTHDQKVSPYFATPEERKRRKAAERYHPGVPEGIYATPEEVDETAQGTSATWEFGDGQRATFATCPAPLTGTRPVRGHDVFDEHGNWLGADAPAPHLRFTEAARRQLDAAEAKALMDAYASGDYGSGEAGFAVYPLSDGQFVWLIDDAVRSPEGEPPLREASTSPGPLTVLTPDDY